MSNPVAFFGNTLSTPDYPSVERKSFSSITFSSQKFFKYAGLMGSGGQYDPPDYPSFDPTGAGERFFVWTHLRDALYQQGYDKPQFINKTFWSENEKWTHSGFITSRQSIMPKLIRPTTYVVDNGVNSDRYNIGFAWSNLSASSFEEGFNWDIIAWNDSQIDNADIGKYAGVSHNYNNISVNAKKDKGGGVIHSLLRNPPVKSINNGPISDAEGWSSNHKLVVDGAFMMMLNLKPADFSGADKETTEENQPLIQFDFGNMFIYMSDMGSLKAQFVSGTDREENTVDANMVESKAKDVLPQHRNMSDGNLYVITVVPVWNGVIIQTGIQDTDEARNASTFLPMKKDRSILKEPYSSGFDPTDPSEVYVGGGGGVTNAIPDLSGDMYVRAKNMKFEMAYVPCFFSKCMFFDQWFVANKDTSNVSYEYNEYPIWTDNKTSSVNIHYDGPTSSDYDGPVENTEYRYTNYALTMDKHDRYAGEMFGTILEVVEESDFAIKNSNGSFRLTWTEGDDGPGHTDANDAMGWKRYVQSISVSMGLDGISGSVSVDKYGVAGQDAEVDQSIGALTIDMEGGYGTYIDTNADNPGRIFSGLAMGVTESKSSEGANWEISLVGVEKKLEDIALINVPFFDGHTVKEAVDFLTDYAGISVDYQFAPNASDDSHRLSVSQDINTPVFDWKSGTSVQSALNDVMEDRNYSYVIRSDGTMYIYELDEYGLPAHASPGSSDHIDWKDEYENVEGYGDVEKILTSLDHQPDFEDLRNEIVVIGLRKVPDGEGTKTEDIPRYPRFETRSTDTTPDVPWAKSMIKALPGTFDQSELTDKADNIQKKSSNYLIMGSTTVPGNSAIKPYDRWGDLWIHSVSHNIDFTSKTWTTDLEFSKQAVQP